MSNVYTLFCILTTLVLIIWCCYEYGKDEDVSEVLFKEFYEDEDSVYPEITFGFPNIFNETVLRKYDQTFNIPDYKNFLMNAIYWDAKMMDVDYKDVGMQLKDYQIEACFYESIYTLDPTVNICKNQTMQIKRLDMFANSYFTLQMPKDAYPTFATTIKIKSSVFPDGIRPPSAKFVILFAYPNQLFRSMSSAFYTWPLRTNASTKHYKMRFNLQSMKILRRRPKKEKPCFKENYDTKMLETVIEESGCTPSMWFTNRSEPLCRTKKSFQELYATTIDHLYRLTKNKKYLDPCLDIEKLQIDFAEENIPSVEGKSEDDKEGWFRLEYVISTNKFEEIKQVRKYSEQSLVGNLGGYIGLCLGYAILNLPTMILEIWKNAKHICFANENRSSKRRIPNE